MLNIFNKHHYGSIFKLIFILLFIYPSTSSASDYTFSHIEYGACSFPFLYTFTASTQSNKADTGAVQYPGTYSYTLKNLNTGYEVTFHGGGPSTVNGSQLTFLGDNPQYTPSPQFCGWPLSECSGGFLDLAYPVEILHGKTVVDLNTFQVISRKGLTEMVNPCQILTPKNYVAPEPRTTIAPWSIPLDLVSGMQRAGVYPLEYAEADVPLGHTHTHLDIFVNGEPVVIPPGIGMVEPIDFFNIDFYFSFVETARIHTHDGTGIIHQENDFGPFKAYTLGQLFDIWQVKFNQNQIGAYCTPSQTDDPNCLPDRNNLSVYANGILYKGDPRQVILSDLNEIAIVYGVPPSGGIPNCYAWPPEEYGNIPNGTPGACPQP